ncbi:MAG: hypothetical protein P3W94_005135 [Paracoccus sp. (in: a-proteobacteria)]|nr:hypothetical protein [Paracoccus sp. (in: a-proteobacteria)]
MAGGFIRGLVHGTAASLVVLAGLSLIAPGPGNAPGSAANDMDAALAPSGSDGPPDAGNGADPAADEIVDGASGRPADDPDDVREAPGTLLDVPVGSEFGRAGDLPPRIPSIISGGGSAPGAPQPVPQPEAEPAPRTATGARDRPETTTDASGPALPGIAVQDDGLGLTVPSPSPREGGDLRGFAPLALHDHLEDRAPELRPLTDAPVARPGPALPIPEPSAATSDAPATPDDAATGDAPSQAGTQEGVAIPRLHAPALDLSLPPDLDDLRRLERN